MNYLEEFEEIIIKEKYIFHIHTNYTDGTSSVYNYFKYSYESNISYLIFTEHVRRELNYNFLSFYDDIRNTNREFNGIRVMVGCEAKILPDGTLDIPEEVLSYIEIICIACHSFPDYIPLYLRTIEKVFRNDYLKDYIRVWVHPGRFFKKLNKLDNYKNILGDLINIAISEGIYIEKNLRENLPPSDIVNNVPFNRKVIGYDAHSVNELDRLRKKFAREERNK